MIKKMNARDFVYYRNSNTGVSIRWDMSWTFNVGTLTMLNADIEFIDTDIFTVDTEGGRVMTEYEADDAVDTYFNPFCDRIT